MPFESHVNDALAFAAFALLLVLVTLLLRSPPRKAMLAMLVVAAVGVVGLWALDRFAGLIQSPSGLLAAREAGLAMVAFGVTQVTVLFVFQAVLAQRKIPRILNEFVVVLALVGYAVYRLNAVGVNLAGLITTSAVVAALAFSAKETLGNLWGGISLQLEKTCRIGDWIRVDTVTGQVVSIRWRYTAIATITNETIVIPNGAMMQNRVTVLARRGEERTPWRRIVPFEVEFQFPPARVIAHVQKALSDAQIPFVGLDRRPSVACTGFDDSGVQYEVAYDLTDVSQYWSVDSQIRVHVYVALMREGFVIPFPRRIVEVRRDERPALAQREIEHRIAALAAMDLFSSLTTEECTSLAQALKTRGYVRDEIIFRTGEPADSLYLLAEGKVDVVGVNSSGEQIKLATLEAPAYFGEMGLLLGQPRVATVIAGGDVVCYRLAKGGFDAIIQARPELAESLAKVLAERQAANDARLQALDAEARARQAAGRTRELMRKIQQFFGLRR